MSITPQVTTKTPWPVLITWSFLLAFAVSLIGINRMASQTNGGHFEVTLTASQSGFAQLFYDRGNGINEADSRTLTFTAGGPHLLKLALPPGRYKRLRFDPTIKPDHLTLTAFRMVDDVTGARHELDPASLGPFHQTTGTKIDGATLTLETTGDDPIINIEFPAPVSIGKQRGLTYGIVIIAWLSALAFIFALIIRWLITISAQLSAKRRPVLWLATACVIIGLPRIVGLGDPLLDWYNFRQTQTALTAYWFAHEGISLPDYALPVLGRPWTAPMEFPTYQIAVAGLYYIGIPIDMAARGFALLCFVASCGLLARLLLKNRTPVFAVIVAGLLALLSPFALVWSRAALIEFLVVLLGLAYVAAAASIHERGVSSMRLLALLGFGLLTALTKITSFTVFWPAVALLGLHHIWLEGSKSNPAWRARLVSVAVWASALLAPLLIAVIWTKQSDAVKAASETTRWLTSTSLTTWNFGTWQQRLVANNWFVIAERIHLNLLPWLWPFALIGLAFIHRLSIRAALILTGLLAGSACTVAVFFNLYVVHDYYLCAIALPLWGAAGIGVNELMQRLPSVVWKHTVLATLVAGLVFISYTSPLVRYAFRDQTRDEVIVFTEKVKALIPSEKEMIVIGDDWNSRLVYYSQRKALMFKPKMITEELLIHYVSQNRVEFIITTNDGKEDTLRLFPNAKLLVSTDNFSLYSINPKLVLSKRNPAPVIFL